MRVPLCGHPDATLNPHPSTLSDSGPYTVLVSNAYGTATSPATVLTVVPPPVITAQPQNQASPLGYPVTFSVTAESLAPLSYQWLKAGTNLLGATGSNYTIPSMQSNHVGTYACLVSNLAGAVLSSNALLSVATGPLPTDVATHSGNLLTRLTHSAGPYLDLAYSGTRLASVTDLLGRQTVFSYDGSGEHLQTGTDYLSQTTAYAYDLSLLTSAATHALTNIINADGIESRYEYDGFGRLIKKAGCCGSPECTTGNGGEGFLGFVDAGGVVRASGVRRATGVQGRHVIVQSLWRDQMVFRGH